jgi:predicted phosphodiesterase
MRYGVLSDIHGNYFALHKAIEALRHEGVDGWICAGDVVGYGPQPNECVQAVAELEAYCVAGNHELMLLGSLSEERSGRLARETIRWTRGVLREDCRSYLAALPLVAHAPGVMITHGSLDDPQEYVLNTKQAAQQLDKLALQHPQANLLVLGHTHRGWIYSHIQGTIAPPKEAAPLGAGRHLLNPGSVGQSRQRERIPRARFMLLDLDQRRAYLRSVGYDVAGCQDLLHRHNLPLESIHLRPRRLRAAWRKLKRFAPPNDVITAHHRPRPR